MAHPNEDLYRKGFEAFQTGDIETVKNQFTDDIVWHVAGRGPFAGDYKGSEEVIGVFGRQAEATGGPVQLALPEVLANEAHAVAHVRATAQRTGTSHADRGVHVVHLRDGKIAESWFHVMDQYAADEFFA
jgi:ketosteroid isomerase-like protein